MLHVRFAVLCLLFAFVQSQVQCQPGFGYNATTGYCYARSATAQTQPGYVCPEGSDIATFTNHAEAQAVITMRCSGQATGTTWNALKVVSGSYVWLSGISTSTAFITGGTNIQPYKDTTCTQSSTSYSLSTSAGKLCITASSMTAYYACCQATPLPSPSVTKTASVTPSVTRTASVTPSVTTTASVTPSVTGSMTTTPSGTPSTSMSPSNTASVTMSATNTATETRTRSPTVSPTKTPSGTMTPSKTRSSSITSSRSSSSSSTPSKSPSPTWTPSPSASVPPVSPSPTPSATVSPTVTVTQSSSPSATLTETRTGTSSTSGSVTKTSSWTPTTSMSPTVSPAAFRVIGDFSSNFTNTVFDLHLQLISSAFFSPNAILTVRHPSGACSNASFRKPHIVTATCAAELTYWIDTHFTLNVSYGRAYLVTTYFRPAEALLTSQVNISSYAPRFFGTVKLKAPYLGLLAPTMFSIFFIKDGASVGNCSNPYVVWVDAVECSLLYLNDGAFRVPLKLAVSVQGNTRYIYLPTVQDLLISKPIMTLLWGAGEATVQAGARMQSVISGLQRIRRTSASVFFRNRARLSSAVLWGQFTTAERLDVRIVNGVFYQLNSTDGTASVRMRLGDAGGLVLNNSNRTSMFHLPTMSAIIPSKIQWSAHLANATFSFVLRGAGFGFEATRAFQRISIGSSTCPNIIHVNDDEVRCSGWQWDSSKYTHSLLTDGIPLPVEVQWYGANISSVHATVVMHADLFIADLIPRTLRAGMLVGLYGNGFQSTYAIVAPRVLFAQKECAQLTIISDNFATCVAPTADTMDPDYPMVNVTMYNAAGVSSNQPLQAFYQVDFAVTWLDSNQTQQFLPSGNSAVLKGRSPIVQILVSGYGLASCSVAVQHIYMGKGSARITSGAVRIAEVQGVSHVGFYDLGIHVLSNTTVALAAFCTDSSGATFAANSLTVISTPAWRLAWEPGSVVNVINMQGFETVRRLAFQLQIEGRTQMDETIPSLFECSLQLFRVSGDSTQEPVSRHTPHSSDVCDISQQSIALCITYQNISLHDLKLDTSYALNSICIWGPTAEVVASESHTFRTPAIRPVWYLDSVELDGRSPASLLRKRRYKTRIDLIHNARQDRPAAVKVHCAVKNLEPRSSATALLLQAETVTADLATPSLNLSMGVDGPPKAFTHCALRCTIWGQTVQSEHILVQLSDVSIVNVTSLPLWGIPSSVEHPVYIPSFALKLDASYNVDPPSAACSVTTDIPEISVTSGGIAAQLELRGSKVTVDRIVLTESGKGSEHYSGLLLLVIVCVTEDAELLPAFSFTISIPVLHITLTSPLPRVISSQGLLSTWQATVALRMGDGSHPTHTQEFQELALANSFCSASIPWKGDKGAAGYTRSGDIMKDQNATVIFSNFAVMGNRGQTYWVETTCSIGALSASTTFVIQLLDCEIGTIPSTLVCDRCPPGTYSLGGGQRACTLCPDRGTNCDDGLLRVLPSYYRPPSQNGLPLSQGSEMHQCFNAEACTVNASSFVYGCSLGYTGPLCGVCDAGADFVRFGNVCQRCWARGLNKFILVIVVLSIIAGAAYLGLRRGSVGRSDVQIVARITLAYIQALTSLQLMKCGTTALFRSIMGWTEAVGVSIVGIGPVQCVLRSSFVMKYIATIALPLGIAALVVACVAVVHSIRACKRRGWSHEVFVNSLQTWLQQRRHVSVTVFLAALSYMPIVTASLQVLDCTDRAIDGKYYVSTDLSLSCNAPSYLAIKVLAIIVLLAFGLGFPSALFVKLAKTPDAELQDEKFSNAFSFLYQGYRIGTKRMKLGDVQDGGSAQKTSARLVWWEAVVLLRKASIVGVAVIVTNPYHQVVGAILVFAVFTSVQQMYEPYMNPLFNQLETMVLVALFLTAAGSGILLRSVDEQGSLKGLSNRSEYLISASLLLVNFITLLVLGYTMMRLLTTRAANGQLGRIFRKVRPSGLVASSGVMDFGSSLASRRRSTVLRMGNPLLGMGYGTEQKLAVVNRRSFLQVQKW